MLAASVCTQESCGDGVVEADIGETCDDGNKKSGDGCSSSCQLERGWACGTADAPCTTVCGDGIVVGSEKCDEGSANGQANSGCSSTCQAVAGWSCPAGGGTCKTTCGDGIVVGNEQCDDGAKNGTATDGCSATCTVVTGYACSVANEVSTCTKTVCGNGKLEGTEECDDGNLVPYDGCSPTCTLEPKCSGGICSLQPVCGDGIVEGTEGCDDGNTVSGDGCSSACAVENGWSCTNEAETAPPSLTIPILYRDMLSWNTFKNDVAPGNPDFNSTTLNTAAGPVVTGLVNATLGKDNEPVWASDGGGSLVSSSTLTDSTIFCWWYHETGCNGTTTNPFDQLVSTDASKNPLTLVLASAGSNTYSYTSTSFFPIDGLGWNAATLSASATSGSAASSSIPASRSPRPTRPMTASSTTSTSRASSIIRSPTRRACRPRPRARCSSSSATTTSGGSSPGSSSSTSAASTARRPGSTR